jgi:membrane protease YdiL (CAAX protease family)
MNVETRAKPERLWVYTALPAILLNLVGCIILGAYYGLEAQRPELAADIGEGQAFFAMYVFISLVEWAFAASILLKLKRDGVPVLSLVAPDGSPWRIKWAPAALVFVAFNALFAAYVALYACALGGWPSFEDWTTWQRVFMVGFVPVTAGLCEELIWRGYVITRLEARGRKGWSAILLSALSFALIHGVLPDRLLVTFLLGVVAGFYYSRQRNLIPLMVTHVVVDVWSFALSAFGG